MRRRNRYGSVRPLGLRFRGSIQVHGKRHYTPVCDTPDEVEDALADIRLMHGAPNLEERLAQKAACGGVSVAPLAIPEIQLPSGTPLAPADVCEIVRLAGDGMDPDEVADESLLPIDVVNVVLHEYAQMVERLLKCEDGRDRQALLNQLHALATERTACTR